MICEKCKTEVLPTAKFCPKCGAKVEITVAAQDAQTKKCPQCGADNPIFAKFCKVDGYNFQQAEEKPPEKSTGEPVQPAASQSNAAGTESAGAAIRQASPPPIAEERTIRPPVAVGGGKSSTGPIIAVIVALLVLVGAGAYLYFSQFAGKDPAKVGEQINNELKGKGLNLYCEIDKNWTATLKGAIKSAAEKETAISVVKAHKEVKDVKDELQPQVSPSDLKLAIDNALTGVGLMDIRADVDENLVATLHGTALSESDKADAVKTAKAVDKVKDVKDNIQLQAAPPPAETASQPPLPEEQPKQKRTDAGRSYGGPKGSKGNVQAGQQRPEPASLAPLEIEARINRALQNAGFSRVRARVGQRFNVTLDGRVATEARRAKAMAIAGSFSGVNKVFDRTVVVGH